MQHSPWVTRAASAVATRCDLEALRKGEIIKLLVTRERDLILSLLVFRLRLQAPTNGDQEPIAELEKR